MCKSWCEALIAIVVIVFALIWDSWAGSQWVILVAGIVLLVHSFTCKKCFANNMPMTAEKRRK